MNHAKPLPGYLVRRFQGWRATQFEADKPWFSRLAEVGQQPRAMVISCCDSRVHVTSIFGAETGEFFIHRNVANLVPPYAPNADFHGTSASVEYAVTALKVAHMIVIGHSGCGGVAHCLQTCRHGHADRDAGSSFVSKWMEILRPGYEKVAEIEDDAQARTELEKQGVLLSLSNLMTFPFVREAVEAERLSLHGLWNDIGTGGLEVFEPEAGGFVAVGTPAG